MQHQSIKNIHRHPLREEYLFHTSTHIAHFNPCIFLHDLHFIVLVIYNRLREK